MAKKKLDEAIEEHMNSMAARRKAPDTIRQRRRALLFLLAVTGNIYVDNITPIHLQRVFASHEWSESTHNLYLSQYKVFFGWARNRRYMSATNDPLYGWDNLKVPNPEHIRIPVDRWNLLFDACKHPRDRIIIATGLFLFLRGSEQSLIQLKHIHLDRHEIEIFRKKTTDWDTMPISSELAVVIREWLTWYANHVDRELREDDYLIPVLEKAKPGRKANGQSAFMGVDETARPIPTEPITRSYKIVNRVLRDVSMYEPGEGEHTLRRSGARALFDELRKLGYDGAIRRVQSMLGHSTSKHTEQYIGLTLEKTQRNEQFGGKAMFPSLTSLSQARADGTVVDLATRRASHGA